MKADPILATVIEQVGPCKLVPQSDYFSVLVRSIVAQQISTKAANSIGAKLLGVCGERGYHPERMLELSDDELQSAGISTNKRASLRSLASHFLEYPHLDTTLDQMTDDEVIANLIEVRGIGVWTAQMFLMFSLNRPDIFPVGDLGIQLGMKDLYKLKGKPKLPRLEKIAKVWQPYRTVASWYIWRARDMES